MPKFLDTPSWVDNLGQNRGPWINRPAPSPQFNPNPTSGSFTVPKNMFYHYPCEGEMFLFGNYVMATVELIDNDIYHFSTQLTPYGDMTELTSGNGIEGVPSWNHNAQEISWKHLYMHNINALYVWAGKCFRIYFSLFNYSSEAYSLGNTFFSDMPTGPMPVVGQMWQTAAAGSTFDDGVATNLYRQQNSGNLILSGFRASTGDMLNWTLINSGMTTDGNITDAVLKII